jgi:L-fucose dehydrogenase
MDLGLKDKVILVNMDASGFGESIIRALSGEGAIVVIIGRNETKNLNLQLEMELSGNRIFSITAEPGNPAECENAVNAIGKEFGRIEGLVNNVSVNGSVDLHNILVHNYLMAHYVLPYLKSSKGSIVNISSKTAGVGQGNTAAYATVNGGQNALTREWAVELLKYGIRVNSLIVAESRIAAEIAYITAFLLSGKSSHTTGQLIHVDGGYVHLDWAQANA